MSTRSFHKLIFISFFIQISAISCIVSNYINEYFYIASKSAVYN